MTFSHFKILAKVQGWKKISGSTKFSEADGKRSTRGQFVCNQPDMALSEALIYINYIFTAYPAIWMRILT